VVKNGRYRKIRELVLPETGPDLDLGNGGGESVVHTNINRLIREDVFITVLLEMATFPFNRPGREDVSLTVQFEYHSKLRFS